MREGLHATRGQRVAPARDPLRSLSRVQQLRHRGRVPGYRDRACPDAGMGAGPEPGPLMLSARVPHPRMRHLWWLAVLLAVLSSTALLAQYQRQPPDFGGTYAFPTHTHPEPRADWLRTVAGA